MRPSAGQAVTALSVSLLSEPGGLGRGRRVPMPLLSASHTLGQIWALPGACAVERLR